MSRAAADFLAQEIRAKPDALLCMATGATPMRSYELLAQNERAMFGRLRVIKLDEWGGIPMESPATCETFLRRSFVGPLGLASRYIGFESHPADFGAECERIESWLAANGPIDICVLGLGINGHLGFNEPARSLRAHAHVAKLAASSLQHSMIAAEKAKPTVGITLGVADLLHSRHILLVVSGESKKGPMENLLSGEITTQFPASFLHLHPNVTVICDRAAFG